MRPIDADALKERMLAETPEHEKSVADLFLEAVAAMIDEQPTIEERKKGKWMSWTLENKENGELYQSGVYCDNCGYTSVCEDNFCPNCGADMREK